jgi:hypothetical protein
MNHPKEELLALSAGGDLPLWSAWLVRRHLRSCTACRETREAYANLRVGLSALPAPEPPMHLAATILSGVPRHSEPAPARFALFGPLAATAALAAAGVLAVLMLPLRHAPLPAPPPVAQMSQLPKPPQVKPSPLAPMAVVETPATPPEQAFAKSPETGMSQIAKFTTVAEAEEDRDRRYLAGFAVSPANGATPRTNQVLDPWLDHVRVQDRHLPHVVVGLRAEMYRSHALPARVETVALPGSPLEIVSAEALFAEGHLIDPMVEVRNASTHVIHDYQIVWVFCDASGAEFRGRLMSWGSAAKALGPGARAKLSETIVLEADQKAALATAKVFLRSATVGNGNVETVWVPERTVLASRNLGEFLPLPTGGETARLLDEYRRSGMKALAQLK